MRTIYSNKLVKNTLNAYMKAVKDYDTTEVYINEIDDNDRYYDCALWEGGRIVVRWGKGETRGTTPLENFPVYEQNFVTRALLTSMHEDMNYYSGLQEA